MTDINEDHNHSDTELSDGAHELVLHGDNDSHLHRSSHRPIVKNLEKKHKKGVYDHEKAKKLWKYHADRAAQSYTKEHGHAGQKWHELFSTKDRKAAASHWADSHHEEMKAGNFHESEEDHAAEIVFASMAKKSTDVNSNFKVAVLERARELIDDVKEGLTGNFIESFKLNPAKKGMWDGYSEKSIAKAKSASKKDGNVTREREATFALTAKKGKI